MEKSYLVKYKNYVDNHIENVIKAYNWLCENTDIVFNACPRLGVYKDFLDDLIKNHDSSKFSDEEFIPYAKYFYGNEHSCEITENFEKAWKHHYQKNEHHPEHWVFGKDVILDMPIYYIIEMICDWWSFSFDKSNLYEIFDYYDKAKDDKPLSKNTKYQVESILDTIEDNLIRLGITR